MNIHFRVLSSGFKVGPGGATDRTCVRVYHYMHINTYIYIIILYYIYIYSYIHVRVRTVSVPVVPHKAVAEVSKIGNL